ncbi:MAG: hypothetical protein MJB14_23370 [Spirochaetes bacterium]|nr:hypothetical protein [Spirochaetota bacterium]
MLLNLIKKNFSFLVLLICFFPCFSDTFLKGKPLSESIKIDGKINFAILKNIQKTTLEFYRFKNIKKSHTASISWGYINDDKHLYIAISWGDDDFNGDYHLKTGPKDIDAVHILLDNNGNLSYEDQEDRKYVIATPAKSDYVDSTKINYDRQKVSHGLGIMRYDFDLKQYQAEFLLPLEKNEIEEKISNKTRINFMIQDHCLFKDGQIIDGYFSYLVFDDEKSVTWPQLKLKKVKSNNRQGLPGDLTGLIVFISDMDHPLGEIYTFNLASQQIQRITYNNMYEDTISLSYDRKKVAFMGSNANYYTSIEALKSCEIYTIAIDGSNLKQLTNNDYLEGHPGWSPDGKKIVFGAYNPKNQGGHLYLMNSDGSKLHNLTLLSDSKANKYWVDEMDPEFLPNGDIIFKTNRFHQFKTNDGTHFQLQIARMNQKGKKLEQITFHENMVDHDPAGNNKAVLFERAFDNVDFTTMEGIMAKWEIIETELKPPYTERQLTDDPWINWLPVYDPSRQYIAYIRSCGYSEVRLLNRATGKDLGRLIPGVTSIRYFDWK